jgi:hypothetical protein
MKPYGCFMNGKVKPKRQSDERTRRARDKRQYQLGKTVRQKQGATMPGRRDGESEDEPLCRCAAYVSLPAASGNHVTESFT